MTANGDGGFEVQRQIRQNAQDLDDFSRGFVKWHEEMQAKDRQLLESKDRAAASRLNKRTLRPEEEEGKKEGATPPQAKPRRFGSPPDEAEAAKPSQANKDVPSSVAMEKQQAVAEKDRGNAFFKDGKYDKAVACYSRGIQCDPQNAILPANRAMALLKLGDFKRAEEDCTVAVGLDPSYVKAYQRRATAREGLGNLEGSGKDHQKVLRLEPSNRQAKMDLERLKAKAEEAERRSKTAVDKKKPDDGQSFEDNIRSAFKPDDVVGKTSGSPEEAGRVLPIVKKPHERSKRPLKRINIKEVGGDDDDKVLIREVSSRHLRESSATASKASEEPKTNGVATDDEGDRSRPKPAPTQKRDVAAVPPREPPSKESILRMSSEVRSSVGFNSSWRALPSCEAKFEFLNAVMPTAKAYSSLFKSSMESKAFEDIVGVLHSKRGTVDVETMSRHVYGLSRVPRIAAIVMFVDDRKKLDELVECALQASKLTDFQAKSIKSNLQ